MPATALDLSLVIQKYQKLTAPFGFDFEGLGLDFGSFPRGFWLDFGSFPKGFWLDFAVFQQGLGLDFGGLRLIFDLFWVSGRLWLPDASWEVFWAALG